MRVLFMNAAVVKLMCFETVGTFRMQ